MPCNNACSQEIKLIDINADNFPVIEAVFKSQNTGSFSLPVFNLSDFTVEEKSKEINVFQVTNPKSTAVPLSIVLVLDISGSMNEERMTLVTDAAKNFIQRIQLEYSEIAILTFNNEVYINCDFTQDRRRLLLELTDLVSSGGTDYNQAFLNEALGALEVVKEGLNKRIIVFLTDGQSVVNTEQVIQSALADNVEIYTVTVELPEPSSLREISQLTGGSSYEAMQTAYEIEHVYSSISTKIQSDLYGKVYWRAEYGCDRDRKGILNYKGFKLNYAYRIPESKTSQISLSTTEIKFSPVAIGETQQQSLTMQAINAPLYLNQSSILGDVFYMDKTLTYPDTILPGTKTNLVVNFSPVEEGIAKDRMRISFSNCPDKLINLLGGEQERIELLHPVGGEKFTINSNTQINWRGIKTDRAVDAYYRMADTLYWIRIGTGKGGSVAWKTPSGIGRTYQVKLEPEAVELPGLELKISANLNGFSPTNIASNKNRDAFALVGNNGELRIYTNRGTEYSRAFGFSPRGIYFNSEDMLLSVSRFEVSSHTYTGITRAIYSSRKRLLHAVPLENGGEFYISAGARRLNSWEAILSSPLTSYQDTLRDNSPIREAAISMDGKRILTLNSDNVLKLIDGNTRELITLDTLNNSQSTYIINPNSKTALVRLPDDELEMMELESGQNLFELSDYTFKNFSASGNYFIASKDSLLYCIDSYQGDLLYTLSNTSYFRTTNSGYGMIQFQDDTLSYVDIKTSLHLYKIYIPLLESYQLSPNDKKLLLLRSSGDHSVVSMPEMKEIASFRTRSASTYMASFSYDSRDILLTIDNQEINYWSPPLLEFEKAVSGKFSIIKPSLNIPDTIWLENHPIGENKFKIIPDLISNTCDVPVIVDKLVVWPKGSSFINLTKGIENKSLSFGESLPVELGYSYDALGLNCNKLQIITKFDTLSCAVCGTGEKVRAQLVEKYFNLGTVELNSSIDTTLSILFHKNSEALRIESIQNMGPDTNQIRLSNISSLHDMTLADSLLLNVKFRGIDRGRTSAAVNIRLSDLDEPMGIYLFGDVLAPRRQIITGKVLNREDSSAIQARVALVDLEYGVEIMNAESLKPDGFEFVINADRTYGLFANSPGYLSGSQQLDMEQYSAQDTICRDIYLTPSRSGAAVQLNCIFFDHGTAVLQERSYPELMNLVRFMRENPDLTVEIHGHTDNTGSEAYNLQLSADRANSVMEFLIKKGIEAKRLSIKAWGFEKPVTVNDSEEGRARNRRVEVILR